MFRYWPLALAAAAVAALYTAGFYYGGKLERAKQLEAAVRAVKQRGVIDRDLGSKSDEAVCRLLGGSRDDCADISGGRSASD